MDRIRLSELEPLFVCQTAGSRVADLRLLLPELTRSAEIKLTRDFGGCMPS